MILILTSLILSKIMKKRHQSAKSEIDFDKERANYALYKNELLNNDFSFLKKWMNEKTIDAFTSASIPQTMGSKIKNLISDGLKNAALSAVGVKLNYIDTDAFWVLSGNNLHFFTTDTDGELEEHLIFDVFRIEKATLQYSGLLKTQIGFYSKLTEEYLPKVHVITFDIDGQQLPLEIHDRVIYHVDPTDVWSVKKQLQIRTKHLVVGEGFLEELKSRFPHLISQ
ncbi:hypothetical protein [Flavobacterium notoginsengisoli]|uniref:hypothetical protein n=1 Tax=Flavobacterium notoginsengisoli TaxID=1478199 RepID=UPI00363742FC